MFNITGNESQQVEKQFLFKQEILYHTRFSFKSIDFVYENLVSIY